METTTKKKIFDLNTALGCKRLLAVLVAVMLVCSLFAQLLTTDGGRIKVENISIDARGAVLEGELFYPVGTTDEDKYPAVVIVPGAGVIYAQMRSFAQELAKRNYVVFNINAYGSGASETPVYNENDQGILEYNIFGTPMGCLDAVDFVRTLQFVDQENIGVMGHSQGSRRSGYAALMDCGYYTLNDILLTVLNEKLGVEISAADIEKNADDIAAERLDESGLNAYNILKEQETQNYNTMIRSACLVGSTAEYVNPTAVVTVAGHEVTRSCQVNLCIINGTFDYGYVGFNTSEDLKNAWYIAPEDEVVQGAYYSLNDAAGANEIIGTYRQDTAADNQALADAIRNRTLRTVLLTNETHSKEFFSNQTTAMVIDYFNQTLSADPARAVTDPGEMTFMWREAFNFVALLAMVAMLVPIVRLLAMTRKYQPCVSGRATIPAARNQKLGNILVVVGTILLNGAAIYFGNAQKAPFTFTASGFFPLMITCWAPIYFLEWLAIFGAVIALAYTLVTSSFASLKAFVKEMFTCGPKIILKDLGIAAVFVAAAYLMMSLTRYLFYQDFRLWMVMFSPLTADQWLIVARYALLILPFMFVTNLATNYLSDMTIGKKGTTLDVVITVALAVAGVWALCGITHIVDYSGMMPGKSVTSFLLTYGAVLFLPILTFVSRKAYQLTKTVWVGTFVNTILMAWMLVCMSGTNGSYVPQTWITNFLG